MKSSNIGGQAVLEGIMMKHREEYSVAVRKPDGQIEVTKDRYTGVAGRVGALARIPFVRGIFNFIDSLVLGMKTLTYSASFYEDEEEETERAYKGGGREEGAPGKMAHARCHDHFHCAGGRYIYDTSLLPVRVSETFCFIRIMYGR